MRSFKSYLVRRKINDVSSWLSSSGIKDLAALARFCEVEGIKFDESLMSSYFSKSEPVPVPKKSKPRTPRKAKVVETKPEEDNSTWHVPAAERPIRKTKRARKPRTAKKTTKKS